MANKFFSDRNVQKFVRFSLTSILIISMFLAIASYVLLYETLKDPRFAQLNAPQMGKAIGRALSRTFSQDEKSKSLHRFFKVKVRARRYTIPRSKPWTATECPMGLGNRYPRSTDGVSIHCESLSAIKSAIVIRNQSRLLRRMFASIATG